MANQKILLKRSATQYKIPTTSQLQLGEIGLNTYDGKLFIEKDVSGSASIVELGVGPTFQLGTGGSPAHTHSVSITGQQALDLLNGTASTVTVRSSDASGHTHDVVIKYSATEKGFILNNSASISSNHTSAHTLVSNGGGASSLDSLNDVDTTNIANNKILKYNSTTSMWECVDDAEGTTISALNDIGDVNAASPSSGQVLTWDTGTSKWKPINPTGGVNYTNGTTAPTSPNLGDEYFNTTNDILYKWVNDGTTSAWLDISTDSVLSAAVIDDLGDVDTGTTAPTSGQVLKWNGTNWTPADDIDTTLSLGSVDLTDIGDVDSGATAGQVLKWNGTKWVPSDDAAGILEDVTTTTVGTTNTVVNSWAKASYISAKYMATCKVGTKRSVSEILVLNKDTSTEITEYGMLGDSIVTFTAVINGSNVELKAQSTDASTSVKLTRILQGV